MCVYVCVFLGLRVGKCCQQSSRLFANVWCVSAFFELWELFFLMFSRYKNACRRFLCLFAFLSFHLLSVSPSFCPAQLTQVTGFLLLLWAPWFLCSTLRALPRSLKEKERKGNGDNYFRATKEVGEAWYGFAPRLSLCTSVQVFVPFSTEQFGKMDLPFALVAYFFFWTKVFSFLPRWWGSEKIGNRATHSGSESARHLVVCWLWKWQGLGAVVVLVQGDRRSCQKKRKRRKTKSVNLFIFSGEGPRICAKWELSCG